MSDAILNAVTMAVLDHGSLSKAQILETWGLTEEDYQELHRRVLAGNMEIERGPRGLGGLRARMTEAKSPAEASGAPLIFTTKWEEDAVDRLATLLSYQTLGKLLGELVQTLRRARVRR